MVTFEEFAGLALALPQAHERITWGSEHTFRVGEKIFAMGAPESASVSLKASLEDQSELLAADPETFSVAPYVGRFGWVRVALATADAGELGELLTEAWRRTAPKRLVKAYDTAPGETGGAQVGDVQKRQRRA
ncbi:MmcQ/YjbR family DNA-binding protein [Actinacidiphila rubida]|uniref:Predicted DNA-binding protein, MmcQ/YjbR family n=1 Tax=Actinacidiphila rubida TaxID=310780 RepID=A0A1H8FB41_9ACTN|nr:MmcQ/YjbR family DNA-binding protein [Actinacidiphila rubida]SEN29091.1 Predicted DNA-binding protein, MmcQ/YjbR family [Actinacidiphila rubida]